MSQERRIEYLCRTEDGSKLIYVTSEGGYESFRMYTGIGGEESLREIPIFDVQRLRDGGTTYIFTAEGTFFAPSPLRPPLWGPSSDGSCTLAHHRLDGRRLRLDNPDAFRVSLPIAEEESFTLIDPALYAITHDPDTDAVTAIPRSNVR